MQATEATYAELQSRHGYTYESDLLQHVKDVKIALSGRVCGDARLLE